MEIEMEILIKRFLNYVSFDTQSDEENEKECPSTARQLELARYLTAELKQLGLVDAAMDEHGYVMATLPANHAEGAPVVGFISHMDTSPDASGRDRKIRWAKRPARRLAKPGTLFCSCRAMGT